MVLDVPVLGQRDTKWASQRLGTVDGTTISGYGCIITCMAMIATYYGHPTTPDVEDNWLTDNQGYIQGNLYRNDAFPREFPDCTFDKVVSCTDIPAPLDQIDTYLNAGKPVVVMVDFDHDASDGIQTHFVLLVGKVNNSYVCNDPWFNDQTNFDARYGEASKAINQINFFSGPVPVAAPLPQTPSVNSSEDPIAAVYKGILGTDITQDEQKARNEQLNNGTTLHDIISQVLNEDDRSPLLIQKQNLENVSKQLIDCQNKPLPSPTTIYSNPKTSWGKFFESLAVKFG